MCLFPLYLIRKCEHCDFFQDAGRYKLQRVPCGKCIECLKHRQNDICGRVVTEMAKHSTAHFVTLTYRDNTLPLASSLWMRKDGLEFRFEVPRILQESSLVDGFRDHFRFLRASSDPRYIEFPLDVFRGAYGSGSEFFLRISPSLDRRAFRLWIKNCRTTYERFFYRKLDFKFVFCGEYGGRTCRPHYHILFMGLTDSQVAWMCKRWDDEFGFTLWKKIGTNVKDRFAVARYISKYISKGVFLPDSVKNGDVQKPRMIASKYLGQLDTFPVSYFLGYDVFGAYNPDSCFCPSLGRCFNRRELDTLFEVIRSRMCITVPGCNYHLPLPQSWKHQIYYNKYVYKDSKKPPRYVPKTIFKLMCEALQDSDLVDRQREFEEFTSQLAPGTSISEAVLRFGSLKACEAFAANAAGEASLVRFYSRDSF